MTTAGLREGAYPELSGKQLEPEDKMSTRDNKSFSFTDRVQRSALICGILALSLRPIPATGQASGSLLTTRAELTAAMQQAEARAARGDSRVDNNLSAAAIRQRLTRGDFEVGDRILLVYVSDIKHIDTLAVHERLVVDLPANGSVSVVGVLRSELSDRIELELLKYVKVTQVEVTPLTRVAILGEVLHPGYFALRADVPLADAIMVAGGASATADIGRSVVRRASAEVRSSEETHRAISGGLTLDQFGLTAGDELVIGKKRQLFAGAMTPFLGAVASVAAIYVALHHR
jgi:protein involved in polysaccharide export with SLBB domain